MITFRSLTTAAFLATGRTTFEAISMHSVEETVAQTLACLAQDIDRAYESAKTNAARITRDVADFTSRLERHAQWGSAVSPNTAADLNADVAKINALVAVYGPLFSAALGIPYSIAMGVLHEQMEHTEEAGYSREWVRRAAGVLQLAKAMHDEAEAIEVAHRAAQKAIVEAAQRAEVEKKAREKAERAAERAETRRNARLYGDKPGASVVRIGGAK